MRLIIDAMGGDLAPQAPVAGALQAIQTYGCQVILVGQEEVIRQTLAKEGVTNLPDGLTIHNATQVIEICDNPSTAWRRKKDSSLTVGMNLLMAGEGDAFLSAGSTGAILTGATFLVKRIPGIRRAAVAPVIPTAKGQAILIDAGANAECTPEYFLQFACMGSFYAHKLLGLENPKVGLLNIGAEPSKGSEHYKTVHQLLQKASDAGRINFIGNVEGNSAIGGEADVIVCDGFVGNIFLKTFEGTASFLLHQLKDVFLYQHRHQGGGAAGEEAPGGNAQEAGSQRGGRHRPAGRSEAGHQGSRFLRCLRYLQRCRTGHRLCRVHPHPGHCRQRREYGGRAGGDGG